MKTTFLKNVSLAIMITVCFSVIFAYTFSYFSSDQNFKATLIPVQEENEVLHSVSTPEQKEYARENLAITLPAEYEKMARFILMQIPESHFQSLRKIVADTTPGARRGLASFKSMYLGVQEIHSSQEFRRVFIHELGHVLDLGGLVASQKKLDSGFRDGANVIYETDPSLDFYRLCWTKEHMQNGKCSDLDFVSKYGQADAFEDFAESYLLFIENNASFVEMAKESDVIAKKYQFFAQIVFNGKIPQTGTAKLPQMARVWDLTEVQ